MEIIDLEMIPGGPKKTCHASQFDNGRVIRFNLKENGQPFALSGTETVQAIIRKPDGSETTLDIANTSSTYVDLITEVDTCDIAGVNHCEMKVTEDGEDLGSGNFDMKVEEDAYGGGDISVGTASGPIASFETDIKDDLIECKGDISYRAEGYKQATFINSRSMPQKDTEPYLFRTAGGSLQNIGGQEYDTLVGGTVAFNQLWGKANASFTANGISINYDKSTGKVTIVVDNPTGYAQTQTAIDTPIITDHKYLMFSDKPLANGIEFYNARLFGVRGSSPSPKNQMNIVEGGSQLEQYYIYIYVAQTTPNGTYEYYLNCVDLTQMFGSTIADYIYGLEQATAGVGVAFFKKLFPNDYYPYNAGEIISVKTSGHITRGLNQWDEEWETGAISSTGDIDHSLTNRRTTSFIPVTGNTIIYFACPDTALMGRFAFYDANKELLYFNGNGPSTHTINVIEGARYLRITLGVNYGTTYGHDICVNISGDKDGTYEPYEEHAYPLDDIELRGIPKLINNKLEYDGDTYESNGSVTRKYGIVTLDKDSNITLGGYGMAFKCSLLTGAKASVQSQLSNVFTSKLIQVKQTDHWGDIFTFSRVDVTPAQFFFNLGSSISTVEDAKTYLTSNPIVIVYELATPTAETADAFTNPQAVNKYGTEEYIDGRTVEMPVGHSTVYGDDIQAKRATFPERIYGGEINMTTGELTSTKNADGTDKATPDTYQLTPKNLEARSGQNNIMNDTNGNTAVKFYTRA